MKNFYVYSGSGSRKSKFSNVCKLQEIAVLINLKSAVSTIIISSIGATVHACYKVFLSNNALKIADSFCSDGRQRAAGPNVMCRLSAAI